MISSFSNIKEKHIHYFQFYNTPSSNCIFFIRLLKPSLINYFPTLLTQNIKRNENLLITEENTASTLHTTTKNISTLQYLLSCTCVVKNYTYKVFVKQLVLKLRNNISCSSNLGIQQLIISKYIHTIRTLGNVYMGSKKRVQLYGGAPGKTWGIEFVCYSYQNSHQ